MSIDKKISKIQIGIAEEQNDKVYVTNKAMSNIQLLNGTENSKTIVKNVNMEFKPLKRMILEPIGKKSPGMHRDKSIWMDNSKKSFRNHIEQIVEREKEVCDIIRNSLGNSYIKTAIVKDEFKRKEESFSGEGIVFEKEYFNGLLE
ncbi:hypothetical protein SteCoe_20578 [Stentor coeruleus]|uniref:Uncharacterized protein n=1 Tax=Stentor coeruleus TaxID=5963 RepID=A0A1R2BRJ5_9CILI|nr:hypothetical protein SteCoe_20578 [Stentor coeruleus]